MFSEEVKKVCDYYKNKHKNGLRRHKLYNQIKSETNFLPEKTNISQRFWHILNNTKDIPKCLECGIKEVKWHRHKKSYQIFCSCKCSNNNINIQKQKNQNCKQTNLKKYGVDNPMKSKRFQDKLKQTNLIRYGVVHPMKLEEYRDKFSDLYQNKSEEEKEDIIRKYKQTILNRYGVENFNQKHLSKESLDKLKDPEYLKEQHYIKKKNLTEIAKELGLYGPSSIKNYFHKYNIPILTYPSSTGEKEVVSYIKEIYKKDFPTNIRQIITPLELDIYLEELNLAVEFNGNYWHSDKEKPKDYHFNKTLECYKKKVKLINIYEYEWENSKEEIKYWLNKYITNNLKDIITKDVYLKDIADKKEIILSLNWPINYELLKKNNFKFKETLEPKLIKINNYNIYDAGKIVLERN